MNDSFTSNHLSTTTPPLTHSTGPHFYCADSTAVAAAVTYFDQASINQSFINNLCYFQQKEHLEHNLITVPHSLPLQPTTTTTANITYDFGLSPIAITTTTTTTTAPHNSLINSPKDKNASKQKVSLSDYLKRRRTTTDSSSRILTRENSVDSVSSLQAAELMSPGKEKLAEAEPITPATTEPITPVKVEPSDLFKPTISLESIESGKSKVNKMLTKLMANNDKISAQKKSVDLLQTRLAFLNNPKSAVSAVPVVQQQQKSEFEMSMTVTDYSAVSSPEINIMSSSMISLEETCRLETDKDSLVNIANVKPSGGTGLETGNSLFDHTEGSGSSTQARQLHLMTAVIAKDQPKSLSRSSSACSVLSNDSQKSGSSNQIQVI